jgi:hypothetical protein
LRKFQALHKAAAIFRVAPDAILSTSENSNGD